MTSIPTKSELLDTIRFVLAEAAQAASKKQTAGALNHIADADDFAELLELTGDEARAAESAFRSAYDSLYGYQSEADSVEVITKLSELFKSI